MTDDEHRAHLDSVLGAFTGRSLAEWIAELEAALASAEAREAEAN